MCVGNFQQVLVAHFLTMSINSQGIGGKNPCQRREGSENGEEFHIIAQGDFVPVANHHYVMVVAWASGSSLDPTRKH